MTISIYVRYQLNYHQPAHANITMFKQRIHSILTVTAGKHIVIFVCCAINYYTAVRRGGLIFGTFAVEIVWYYVDPLRVMVYDYKCFFCFSNVICILFYYTFTVYIDHE